MTKKVILRIWIAAVLFILLGLFALAVQSPDLADLMALNISQNILKAIGAVSGLLPFSIFEFFVYGIVLFCFYFIISLIVHLTRKNWVRLGNLASRTFLALLCMIVLYNYTAGFAYYRTLPDFELPAYEISDSDAETAMLGFIYELYALADQFADENGTVSSPYTFEELSQKINEEYDRLGDWFYTFSPRVKPITFDFFLSYTGFSGVFFGPTAEPNINMLYKDTYYIAHVIAHELAHARGVMRERDAETTARYLLISSSDPYLRYCGLMTSYGLILDALQLRPDYEIILSSRPEAMDKEWNNIMEQQAKYSNPLQPLFDKLNGWFINQNNQTKGSDEYLPDYGDIITPPIDPNEPVDPSLPVQPPEYTIVYSDTQKMIVQIFWMR